MLVTPRQLQRLVTHRYVFKTVPWVYALSTDLLQHGQLESMSALPGIEVFLMPVELEWVQSPKVLA